MYYVGGGSGLSLILSPHPHPSISLLLCSRESRKAMGRRRAMGPEWKFEVDVDEKRF
jgi:hypothetical protein